MLLGAFYKLKSIVMNFFNCYEFLIVSASRVIRSIKPFIFTLLNKSTPTTIPGLTIYRS